MPRITWIVAVSIVFLTPPAHARSVLCFGDSTSWLYPSHLQRLRPDWQVINGARPGDVSSNVARLTTRLDREHPDVVVVMIGTNDVALRPDGRPAVTFDPRVTARNIRVLAGQARHAGARVMVLTQTPAWCPGSCPARQQHTREVAHRLVAWGLHPPPGVLVADLRDELTVHSWATLSDDGLHPNLPGAALIAAFVATRLDDAARLLR